MMDFIKEWWLDAFFGIILCTLTFTVSQLKIKLKENKTKNTALENGIKALLHERIMVVGKYHIEKGYCTPEEFEEFEELFKPYEGLYGNGSGTRMYHNVRKLPSSPPQPQGDDDINE